MAEKLETLIKRYDSTAKTYREKGDREWLMQKTDSAESIFNMHGKLMIKQKIFRAAQII